MSESPDITTSNETNKLIKMVSGFVANQNQMVESMVDRIGQATPKQQEASQKQHETFIK